MDEDGDFPWETLSDVYFGEAQPHSPPTWGPEADCDIDMHMSDTFDLPELAGIDLNPPLSPPILPSMAFDDMMVGHGLPFFDYEYDQQVSHTAEGFQATCVAAYYLDENDRWVDRFSCDQQTNCSGNFIETEGPGGVRGEGGVSPACSKADPAAVPERHTEAGGRRDRFDADQIAALHQWLSDNQSDPFPDAGAKGQLSRTTGLSVRRIERWFARTRQRKLQRAWTAAAGNFNLSHGVGLRVQPSDEHSAEPLASHTTVPARHVCEAFRHSRSLCIHLGAWRSGSTSTGSAGKRQSTRLRLRTQSCAPRIEGSSHYRSQTGATGGFPSASDAGASLDVAVASPPPVSSLPDELPSVWLDEPSLSLTATAILEQSRTDSQDALKVRAWLESLPGSFEPSDQPPPFAPAESPLRPPSPPAVVRRRRRRLACWGCFKRKVHPPGRIEPSFPR